MFLPVTSFRLDGNLGGELNTGIDDILLGGPAAVPEASDALLVGTGLFAAARRRGRHP
jgi:hypothetical protein